MLVKQSLNKIEPYVTLDKSVIYELLNPLNSPLKRLSVALAVVEEGMETRPHIHTDFDEIYFIVGGSGTFRSNKDTFEIKKGDIIYIPRNTVHSVVADKGSKLEILCICIPPYKHETTKLV